MTAAIHRAARHALPDDPLRDAKVAQAVEVMDRAAKVGRHDATALQATREAREAGKKVCRASWKHRDFFYLVPGSNFKVNRLPLLGIYPEGTDISYQPHIDQRKTNGEIGVADINQADMLAEDWRIVE